MIFRYRIQGLVKQQLISRMIYATGIQEALAIIEQEYPSIIIGTTRRTTK